MDDLDQVKSYVQAYAWGGPTSALQIHHLRELACMIRSGNTVLDLACGPGPLLLELAAIYPDSRFIGVDLSSTMLQHLEQEAVARNLSNIVILQEDIRTLPSLANTPIDLVISTSALHHLPDEDSLRQVFRRIRSLLKPGGGFYLFDFGLLKSSKTREIFVAEVAKLAPPLTVRDYDLSLQAAFPIDHVFRIAKEELPKPFAAAASAFFDFFYFLQTPCRANRSGRSQARIKEIWPTLPLAMKIEHLMIRWLRRTTIFLK
ncbi:MAG: class I SAM-dependent methyltransferase [Candidatus Competibacter sp.]|nr:class I SAM-dependent methyltransferase [Candidatus Competibacter sp.]